MNLSKKLKSLVKNGSALFMGCLFAFILAEIAIRIINPFPSRIKGDKIVLKANLSRKVTIDPPQEGLDETINYSANSIGFRGPNPDDDLSDNFSIITVGGSTTECSLLDDEKTWSQQLYYKLKEDYDNVWLNNGGLDGCTTNGHLVLLEDYIIKLQPTMVAFLIGVNDRGRANFDSEDGFLINRKESLIRKLSKKSEFITLLSNLYETYRAKKVNLYHGAKKATPKTKANKSNPEQQQKLIEKLKFHQEFQKGYAEGVLKLITVCKENGIDPVIITQPLLDHSMTNSWKIMDMYNQTALTVAKESNTLGIDLGNLLDKKDKFYYDSMHYNNIGAKKVSEILFNELNKYLVKVYGISDEGLNLSKK